MIVTLTEYRELPTDVGSNDLPLGGAPLARQVRTADGDFAALSDEARYFRIATDTKIHVKHGAGPPTNIDPLMSANTAEYFGAHEGTIISVLTTA